MAYYSPRMSHAPGTAAQPVLGSRAFEAPLTPPSVADLTPSTCLSISQFRDVMRQYRSLDDGVTTRLNRLMARSRDSGLSTSPTILSGNASSSTSSDIGVSTYSVAPSAACATFWQELMSVWTGREQAIRYCLASAERSLQEHRAIKEDAKRVEASLDADRKGPVAANRGGDGRWSNTSRSSKDPFDARKSRGEEQDEFTIRQLHNELAVESIIRKRSLDAFRSRCRLFVPSFGSGEAGARERAMWEGKDTPAAEQSRQQASAL